MGDHASQQANGQLVSQRPPARIEAGDGPQQAGGGRRNRSRQPKPQPPDQPRRQQGAAGRAAPPGLVPPLPPPPQPHESGLTWQQREQFLSAAATPFQPLDQAAGDQAHRGAARQRERPRDAGRGGARRPRGSRGPGAAGVASVSPEVVGQQQQEQGRQADVAAPAGGPAEPAGMAQQPQYPPQEQRQQQARQRRERPPRGPKQQQKQGGEAAQQGLEAAASAAANQRQRQRQQVESDCGGQPSRSASDAEDEAAAGGAAAQPAQDPRQRQRPPRQAGRTELGVASAAAAPATSGAGEAQAAAEPPPEPPHCLVCCSEMAEVAVGACNHKQVCGTCTLRLRLCYHRNDCPLCKTELKEVIIAPWRPQLPDWQAYQEHPEWVARSTKWARGTVCADRWRRGGRLSSRLLHDLARRTALACAVCDPGGEAPFARREHLLGHVAEAHGLRLCSLCLQEGRLFPLELEAFGSPEALRAHSAAAHPHCEFCRRTFYDDDALWKHMHEAHYSCHVCPPPAAAHAYFNRGADLLQHMRREHHLCQEPECADCFVAFGTAEELRRHHLERHSARMPRWDSSRARPLQLDIPFTSRSATDVAAAARRQRPRARAHGPQDVRALDGGGGDQGGGTQRAAVEYEREADGGLLIIDDQEFPSAAAHRAGGGGSGDGGGWAGAQPPRQPRGTGRPDDFPSLAAAAGDGGPAGGAVGAAMAPRLVKKTARCPCGRRVSHIAATEGQEVPPLECDAVCRIEGRRQQLAGAFGVDDPAHHAPYFDRQRSATYSGQLLAAAQQHPRFVEGLERQLAEFVADKAAKRTGLTAMPREQRAVAHALAEQYGLGTRSLGQEPGRCVELLKTATSGIPARLLSRVAPTVPAEEVAKLLRESEGHPIRLIDIAPSVDLRYYLRQWEGAFRLEWQGGDAAVLRFDREQDQQEALAVLGGGIRGLFRIDRAWRPRTAVTAAPATAPAEASGRGWGGGDAASRGSGGGSDEASGGSSSWTSVAVAPRQGPLNQQPPQQQQQSAGGSGGETQRWAVMTGRRSGRPTPVSSAGSHISRNVLADMMPEEQDDGLTSDSSSDSDAN